MLDVLIIGAGPAGVYASLIIKRGTPVQSISEDFDVKVIEAGNKPGGLAKYAFIQITKSWAFPGRTLMSSMYEEAKNAGVSFNFEEVVQNVSKMNNCFEVKTNIRTYRAKFVIITVGIMTFPDVLATPSKTNVGLHTPEEMAREFKTEFDWKNIVVAGNNMKSIASLANKLKKSFKDVEYKLIDQNSVEADQFDKTKRIQADFDGVVFDYNSYKLTNGATGFLRNLDISFINGYLETDNFGMTKIENLYAAGSVSTILSGIPAAIYSAQNVAFAVGRKLNPKTKADPSGRFPFYPRDEFWEDSWQKKLDNFK